MPSPHGSLGVPASIDRSARRPGCGCCAHCQCTGQCVEVMQDDLEDDEDDNEARQLDGRQRRPLLRSPSPTIVHSRSIDSQKGGMPGTGKDILSVIETLPHPNDLIFGKKSSRAPPPSPGALTPFFGPSLAQHKAQTIERSPSGSSGSQPRSRNASRKTPSPSPSGLTIDVCRPEQQRESENHDRKRSAGSKDNQYLLEPDGNNAGSRTLLRTDSRHKSPDRLASAAKVRNGSRKVPDYNHNDEGRKVNGSSPPSTPPALNRKSSRSHQRSRQPAGSDTGADVDDRTRHKLSQSHSKMTLSHASSPAEIEIRTWAPTPTLGTFGKPEYRDAVESETESESEREKMCNRRQAKASKAVEQHAGQNRRRHDSLSKANNSDTDEQTGKQGRLSHNRRRQREGHESEDDHRERQYGEADHKATLRSKVSARTRHQAIEEQDDDERQINVGRKARLLNERREYDLSETDKKKEEEEEETVRRKKTSERKKEVRSRPPSEGELSEDGQGATADDRMLRSHATTPLPDSRERSRAPSPLPSDGKDGIQMEKEEVTESKSISIGGFTLTRTRTRNTRDAKPREGKVKDGEDEGAEKHCDDLPHRTSRGDESTALRNAKEKEEAENRKAMGASTLNESKRERIKNYLDTVSSAVKEAREKSSAMTKPTANAKPYARAFPPPIDVKSISLNSLNAIKKLIVQHAPDTQPNTLFFVDMSRIDTDGNPFVAFRLEASPGFEDYDLEHRKKLGKKGKDWLVDCHENGTKVHGKLLLGQGRHGAALFAIDVKRRTVDKFVIQGTACHLSKFSDALHWG